MRHLNAGRKLNRSASHRRALFRNLVTALLERMAGAQVALLVDPPALVFDEAFAHVPAVEPDWVRVRGGPHAGLEGRVVGLAGPRRYASNVHLEAAWVEIEGEPPVDIPIGDLERFR